MSYIKDLKPGYYIDWTDDILIVYPNNTVDILYYGKYDNPKCLKNLHWKKENTLEWFGFLSVRNLEYIGEL